jgi:2-polyprenyl-6-methoxyphenol hydroxylase-like FAD-dependent oxidoreductase
VGNPLAALTPSLRSQAPDAFAAYERLRRKRVERIVAQGARNSSAKTPGPTGRLLRDLILRVVFRYVVTEMSLAWMYDYRVDLAQPVQRELQAA